MESIYRLFFLQILFLVFQTYIVVAQSEFCPNGWKFSPATEHCYYLQNFTVTNEGFWELYDFATAEAKCRQMGAHLVSIHSCWEETFIRELIASAVKNEEWAVKDSDQCGPQPSNPCDAQPVFTGYFGLGGIGVGTWTDGSPFDYFNDEPDKTPKVWAIENDKSCWPPEGGKRLLRE
ncbi:unnamed protein product, partial [Mesorhabditis belari]|uniref:C-type lectin domain-containing protein n=1 Tax=Mesorhabditis belari TaxID=2138241 RepID=A0AAF3EN74_9BILA